MDEADRENSTMTCPECKRAIPKVEERGYGKTYVCDDCGIIVIKLKKTSQAG